MTPGGPVPATPAPKAYVVPLTVAVLVALYAVQSRGTIGIGKRIPPNRVIELGTQVEI